MLDALEERMDTFLTSLVVGAIIGASTVLSVAFLIPRKRCPSCNLSLPRFRKPANAREAMLGGWTCQHCGSKIARDGSLAKSNAR